MRQRSLRREKRTEAERFWQKVERTEECWNWTGAKNQGYGVFSGASTLETGRKFIRAHRYAWEAENGPIAEGYVLDHMCHNPSCVRPTHLREVTHKGNLENRRGANKNNPSGVRGVHRDGNLWKGGVGHHNTYYSAGYFDSIEEAEKAVLALRLSLHTYNDADRAA